MSKNKQISDSEKEKKMLEVFHEYQEFYHIKDLEKLVKNVGISQKQVSAVLKHLLEKNLVKSKKIGPSIYYWSFPEELVVNKDQQKNDLKEEMKALDDKLVTLEEALQETQKDGEDGQERDQLFNSMAELKTQEKDLLDFIKRNEAMDNERAVKIMKESKELYSAANRWTDNVFIIRHWCVKKFNIDEVQLNKRFGIRENFDYL